MRGPVNIHGYTVAGSKFINGILPKHLQEIDIAPRFLQIFIHQRKFGFAQNVKESVELAAFSFVDRLACACLGSHYLSCLSRTFLISFAIASITGTVTEFPNCL